jgi:hypothetical protein
MGTTAAADARLPLTAYRLPLIAYRSPRTAYRLPLTAYRMLAELIVLIHFAFVLFVVFGGLLVLRWNRAMYLHLPAALWGAFIELAGGICPLTPLENSLRASAGSGVYQGGFVEHYILPVLYPAGLTRAVQLTLGMLVIGINLVVYSSVIARRRIQHGIFGPSGPSH